MLFIILVIIIVIAFLYAVRSGRGPSLNEKVYLRRRGYEPPIQFDAGPPVSKDFRLLNLIESLSDISPFARQRAAEDLSRMCVAGQRDARMLSPLIGALYDNDASVRATAAMALGNFDDAASIEALKRRMDVEESIHVKAALERALEKFSA